MATVTTRAAMASGSGAAWGVMRTSATAITPITPGTMPCMTARAQVRVLMRSNTGSSASIRTNEGRKIAAAATTAPVMPSTL